MGFAKEPKRSKCDFPQYHIDNMSGVATRSRSQLAEKVLQEVNQSQIISKTKTNRHPKNEPTGNVVVYYVQNGNEIIEHRFELDLNENEENEENVVASLDMQMQELYGKILMAW